MWEIAVEAHHSTLHTASDWAPNLVQGEIIVSMIQVHYERPKPYRCKQECSTKTVEMFLPWRWWIAQTDSSFQSPTARAIPLTSGECTLPHPLCEGTVTEEKGVWSTFLSGATEATCSILHSAPGAYSIQRVESLLWIVNQQMRLWRGIPCFNHKPASPSWSFAP